MGLLDDATPQQYYESNDLGNYQFVSLEDIINQFMVVYTGENKVIPKARRLDVAFHAQRALRELSFDTFKSTKAQEITLPPSLQMILPQDYVNYTKVSWVDSAGIKHLLNPASKTSNPTPILQNTNGTYYSNLISNGSFQSSTDGWAVKNASSATDLHTTTSSDGVFISSNGVGTSPYPSFRQNIATPFVHNEYYKLSFNIVSFSGANIKIFLYGGALGGENLYRPAAYVVTATGTQSFEFRYDKNENNNILGLTLGMEFGNGHIAVKKLGIKDIELVAINNDGSYAMVDGNSFVDQNDSTTWSSYKSGTSSENQDDYQDDTYWPMDGSRYGLDPQHAQANGSFYIDENMNHVHFSSNISGKTVILDYISDSLGTDEEMQVHKFAEEAVYKCIAYAILSTRANVQEYVVQRYKKERFAAIRTAKLRLSNLKLEELTQILRGKSKQIKH